MTRWTLIAILALAGGLRVWGIDHGLPFLLGRPDEMEALRQTAGFPAGDLNPRWFVYPNLFFWVIWLWLEAVIAGRNLVVDTAPYAELLATDMATLIAWGRLLVALVGVLTVGAVFAVGRRVGGTALGLTAALLLATNYLHVRESHALKADAFLALMTPIALWLLARWAERGGRADAIRAGVVAGIATGLKYPGILLLATGVHADALATGRRLLGRLPGARFWWFAGATVVVFLCASPYLLLDPERLERTFTDSVYLVYGPVRPEFRPAADAPWAMHALAWVVNRSFLYHAAVSLRWGCGLAFALLVPIALVRAWRRPQPFWPLAAGFVVLFFGVMGLSQVTLARYLAPITPLLALVVADLPLTAARRIAGPRARAAFLAVALVALVAEPLAHAVAYDRVASETDTRVLATRWMDAHLPQDATVAVLGSHYFPIADPDVPPPRRRADVPLGATDLDRHGVTHVVVHSHSLPFSQPPRRQLRALQPRLERLARFSPWTGPPAGWFESLDAHYIPYHSFAGVVRPGPVVTIHAWRPPGAVGTVGGS